MFFDDLGQQIGKIRYHDFQNWHFWALNGIFEIKMMMKICLGVIRFQIWIHLDMLELFEKLQKYHPKFKDVDFENHDILFYLFFDLNHHLPKKCGDEKCSKLLSLSYMWI